MHAVRFTAALLVALLVTACAQLQTATPEKIVFELSGRLAASTRAESFTGNLSWRHARSADELLISTPFGQGVARILRQDDAVVLETADGRAYRAADSESLTERVLGFRLPLIGLADWVRGRASPGLEARGWSIEYQEHDAERRPILMRLTYPGIELRLAVSEWK